MLGGLRSAFPMATGPAPCYEPPSSLPAITTFIPAAAALIFREEVVKGFFFGGAPALLLPIPPWLAQPGLHPPKTKCPRVHPSLLTPGLALSATRGEGEEEEEEEGDKEPAPWELIAW